MKAEKKTQVDRIVCEKGGSRDAVGQLGGAAKVLMRLKPESCRIGERELKKNVDSNT